MIPRTITHFDKQEHFGARFLHIYNENKKLNFAVDLAELDQKGKKGHSFSTKIAKSFKYKEQVVLS